MSRKPFLAGFDGGRCGICAEEFHEGDELVYDSDDVLVHALCAEEEGEEVDRS